MENTKPKTLDGIKKLAKKIKKAKEVKHTEALELASKQAGFQNFRHARAALEAKP